MGKKNVSDKAADGGCLFMMLVIIAVMVLGTIAVGAVGGK